MMLGSEMSRKRKISDIKNGTPMDIDMEVDEVAEEKLLDGKVSNSFDKKLEEEYGTEWKKEESASKIHTNPCIFTNKGARHSSNSTGADAERAVYTALQNLNNQTQLVTYYVSKKMFGFVFHGQTFDGEEIDFVYVTINGLMVVECKGITRRTKAQSKYEEACNQLKRKVPTLLSSLGLPSDIPIFKVVSFPLLSRCDIDILDETRIMFKDDLNDLKTWLRRKKFILPENAMSFENYVEIATTFLMNYHGTTFKNSREFKRRGISDCSDDLEATFKKKFYTKEQLTVLNVDHCEDMWIIGAAGTGKTLVLKDRVKLLADQYPADEDNKKILVITYNIPIKMDIELWVEKNTKNEGKIVRVQNFSAMLGHIFQAIREDGEQWNKVKDMHDEEKLVDYVLEQEILKKYFKSNYTNTSKYRHILVDEAQDLPGKWLALLDAMLNKNGKSNIWIFEDPFQVVRKSTRPDNSAELAHFTKHALTKVFRNTHNVFEAYQHCYESLREEVISTGKSFSNKELSPPSVDHDVYGLSPEYITAESDNQLGDSLVTTLRRLQSKGVPFYDVAVITSCVKVARDVRVYLEAEDIKCENAEKYRRNKADSPVVVDSYQRFKGLEAKVLIFFIPCHWTPEKVDIYVGFSRSFCHLIVIGTKRMINKITQDKRD